MSPELYKIFSIVLQGYKFNGLSIYAFVFNSCFIIIESE